MLEHRRRLLAETRMHEIGLHDGAARGDEPVEALRRLARHVWPRRAPRDRQKDPHLHRWLLSQPPLGYPEYRTRLMTLRLFRSQLIFGTWLRLQPELVGVPGF